MTHDPNHQSPTSSTSSLALSPDGSPVPTHWVEDLFQRLTACFGATSMAALYGGIEPSIVKDEWAAGLADLTSSEVQRGLVACRSRKGGYAPNLPDFVLLCRPGLDPETAWHEAEAGLRSHADGIAFAWSHPAVFHAAREMQFELRGQSFKAMEKRWASVLTRSWAKRIWGSIPDPTAKRIEPPQHSLTPTARENGLAELNAVRDRLADRLTSEPQQRDVPAPETVAAVDFAERQRVSDERVREYAAARGIPL